MICYLPSVVHFCSFLGIQNELIDLQFAIHIRRWAGIAKGVGVQKIIGRVHVAQVQIENVFLITSFSVLEDQSMDMLLGLDMLKRHQVSRLSAFHTCVAIFLFPFTKPKTDHSFNPSVQNRLAKERSTHRYNGNRNQILARE